MAEITKFDFDGLSDQHVQVHEEYGPLVQAHNFIRWAGWSNTHEVVSTHLQPGDRVEISTRSEQGKRRGALPEKEQWLTKRGVRRLLFRSNHPKAIEYADKVMDLLDLVDEAEKAGIDVVSELKEQIANLEEAVELTQSEATGAYLQLGEAYEKAYRAARLSSSKDTWAMNVYSGKTFNIPPKYQTSMEEWKRLAEEEGWDM